MTEEKKKMTPQERAKKMQEARKANKESGGKKVKKASKKSKITYKAPEDFKPHFLSIRVKTDKDGLLGSNLIEAIRYLGKYDRKAIDRKKKDMMSYDPTTVIGLMAKLSAITYKANASKIMPLSPKERKGQKLGSFRLPANTTFEIVIRAGRKVDGNILTARIVNVIQIGTTDKGKQVFVELDRKTDYAYRNFMKFNRLGAAAFQNTIMFPKATRRSKSDEIDSDDED